MESTVLSANINQRGTKMDKDKLAEIVDEIVTNRYNDEIEFYDLTNDEQADIFSQAIEIYNDREADLIDMTYDTMREEGK